MPGNGAHGDHRAPPPVLSGVLLPTITLARHAENMKSWADVRKYLAASNLFTFLFFNKERPALEKLRQMFGSGGVDAAAAK